MNANTLIATATMLNLSTVALNATDVDLVPVGARLTIGGETTPAVHIVTARTPPSASPTTSVTISPAVGAGTYVGTEPIVFAPQELEIKVGDGEIKYTEASEYKYDKDRGKLDTVREGDDVPMEVSMNFTFEHVKSGTAEAITPVEAIKGIDAAVEWVSSSSDLCEPYCIDVEVVHTPPCGAVATDVTIFPDFRSEKRDFDFKNASIAVSGKCNATEPIVTRV